MDSYSPQTNNLSNSNIDEFNKLQYIIRESLSFAEIRNAMSYQRHFIHKNFSHNLALCHYLELKVETLGSNKIYLFGEYVTAIENITEGNIIYQTSDINMFEDEKSYFNRLCGQEYEPTLLK